MSTEAPAQPRLLFIDVLRGVGVAAMIQLHTSHGWLQPALRSGPGWGATQFLGGLAAPIFLTLAGVSQGLRWSSAAGQGRTPSYGRDLRRALQLVVLGYLLRLQMWFIDAAGYARPDAHLAQVLLCAAYGLAYFALAPRSPGRPTAAGLAAALVLFGLGLTQVAAHAPDRLLSLLRVDVLQCIGGSLAITIALAAALRGRFARPTPYWVCAAAATFIASWTRSWAPGPLPSPIAAYLAQWAPEPGRIIMGLFPLFPWVAYTLAGAAIGMLWGSTARERREGHVLGLALIALCVALATTESMPHVYETFRSQAWLIQPVRVLNRLAWVLVLASVSAALCRWAAELVSPLDALGRASLLTYWVHLQFAFGAASTKFAKSLGFGAWAIGTLALIIAMWLLALLRVTPRTLEHTADSATR